MAIIVSMTTLAPFMKCPALGANALGPEPSLVAKPVNIVLPVITGDLTVGSDLTVSTGMWTSTKPLTYTYQWQNNGVNIGGATSNIYTIAPGDVGATLSVVVTAHNSGGSVSVSVNAGAGTPGGPGPPIGGLLNSYLPQISGTLTVGSTLTTTNGGWVGPPPITFTYSWQRDGVDIPGATSNTYTTVQADAGHLLTATVFATNATDSNSAYSGAVGPIASAVIVDANPVISGAAIVNYTLTSTTGTWEGVPAPTFAYQWQRNGSPITGATSNTYLLTNAELGMMITCVVTATNPSGSLSAISNSLGPVAAGSVLSLSNTYVSSSAAIGSTVGILSVNGVGPYTYTLTSNPGGKFAISGSNLNVAASLVGTTTVTIQVTAAAGSPLPLPTNFTINVVSLVLSASIIPANALVGTTIGSLSVAGGTGSYTYTLTDPSGKFVISGSNLNVATALVVGTYQISVQATGGSPSPVANNFTILVKAGITWDPATVSNTVLSGGNLIATNTGTTSNDQGARV